MTPSGLIQRIPSFRCGINMSLDRSARNRIYELVVHDRNQRVRFVETSTSAGTSTKGHFEVDGRKVTGLHNFVSKVFSNKPQMSTDTYDPRAVYTEQQQDIIRQKSKCLETKPKNHGKRVDDQFCLFSTHLNADTLHVFKSHFENKDNDPIDPCTVQLISHFQKTCGWVPMTTQHPIFSDLLKMATAVDVIAKSKDDQQTILVELKTSTSMTDTRYADYTEFIAIDGDYNVSYLNKDTKPEEQRKFKLCLANSQYVLDQIQLLLMKWILETEYGFYFDSYCIIRIHLFALKTYYIDKKLCKVAPILIQAMKKKAGC
jgi:hypothetical protein